MRPEFDFPEWLSLFFFSFFVVLAWLHRLEWKRRARVTAVGAVALGLLSLLLLDVDGQNSALRSILPVILMPMAYWQTGLFTAPLNQSLQRMLVAIDRKILSAFESLFPLPDLLKRWLRIYFECAYILVYPMVPSGLFVLYSAGLIDRATEFWTVVLPPAYVCYATLPFIRTLPPRTLEQVRDEKTQRTGVRGFNLAIVRLVTHQANTFPSAHAAAAVAIALELIRLVPAAGIVYLVIAVSIMVGAFIGRYHYAADVILGGALACASFCLVAP
jgi:hypothetical protein